MDIYLNGSMISPDQARVHIEDAGFQHAVGLFETLSVYHGRPFRLDQHLARLATSAQQLGLTRELHTDPLAEGVRACIEHNELDLARLRLTLTAGNLSLLRDQPDNPPAPTVAVVPSAPTRYDPAYFAKGITAVIAPPGANPFDALAGHKTLSYWGRLNSRPQAAIMLAFLGLLALHTLEILAFAAAYRMLLGWGFLGDLGGGFDGSWNGLIYFSGINFATLGYTQIETAGPIRMISMMQSLGGFMVLTWSSTYLYSISAGTWRE